ncbi:MAG: hypothetical protein KDI61_10235 [Alphaproteobacteria bacterium]|nr:hypothetical protein [Alphaproteobacteria bacterium]
MKSLFPPAETDLLLYCLLLGVTVFYFAFLPVSNEVLGILTLLWSTALILRLKDLLDFSDRLKRAGHYDYSEQNPSLSLPQNILSQLSHEQYMQRGLTALRSLRFPSIFWIICGLLFAAWGTMMTLFPAIPAPIPAFKNSLDSFVEQATGVAAQTYLYALMTVARRLCILFLIGSSLWLGQSYAYRSPPKTLQLYYIFLLILAFLVNFANENFSILLIIDLSKVSPYGYGWESLNLLQEMKLAPRPLTSASLRALELGSAGLALFYFPLCMNTLSLLRISFDDYERAASAVKGLLVLSILFFSDLYLAASEQMTALWISGWAVFSPYWMRSHRYVRKK